MSRAGKLTEKALAGMMRPLISWGVVFIATRCLSRYAASVVLGVIALAISAAPPHAAPNRSAAWLEAS